ncbi:hypothetical protein IC229_22205 [Spirosoma sp. BT702]|uniref:Uncharacterized protein n=1 Tax=Spirosoma profusum TaxID=2771354 RepID=A0A926XYS3_9BACT|nr:hypothetical protein [Spirosoma profusum]MBD2703373.1 hypothetical protein [Spirosoma profusum]
MSQNKPKLSDITRQNNTARVSKFASSMIPTPPIQTEETKPVDQEPVQPTAAVITQPEINNTARAGAAQPSEDVQSFNIPNEQTPVVKSTRKRTASLSLDDILSPKAPYDETFSKMTRIAAKHHDLLRELSFRYRKNMNTILYNLLEVLDQTYQREKQNNV